ncbi:MAG: DPP IV N-terminal domain-containing protein [Flavobacteriales bacterium]
MTKHLVNHKKRVIVLFYSCICLSISAYSQSTFTLQDALLNTRQYVPTTLDQYGWMKGADAYYYAKDTTLWIGKLKGKAADAALFTLRELNSWKGGEAMRAIPQIHWTSATGFWFEDAMKFYEADTKTKTAQMVCEYTKEAQNNDYHAASQRLAFTKENNLYAVVNGKTVSITGNDEDVVSGQSISRNEYGISKGTFWNNDGSRLAFYEKDESNVTDYPLTDYKSIPASVREIKYPFAGGSSEIVRVGVYDFSKTEVIYLELNSGKLNDQYYATNVGWSPDGSTVYVAMLNRATTDMQLQTYDAASGKLKSTLFTEHSDKWVEPEQSVHFVPVNANQFLWFSQRTGNNNLYLYQADGRLIAGTSLKWELQEIVGFTPKNDAVFVMGTGEIPTEKMLFKVTLPDMQVIPVMTPHGAHHVSISHTGTWLMDQYSNTTTANKIDITAADGRLIRNLHNAPNPFAMKKAAQMELFTIKADDGSDMWCRLIKPTDFDPKKKYPVVVYVYGGPHAQMVTNSFNAGASLWMNALAEMGYLVFTVDNRGSGNRGQGWEHVVHRQLGTVEVADQMAGVAWLKKQTFVDANRMAVHGWSFGGFMTTTLMLKQPGVFKAGVAGGPVIDWALYEVMYGERYMDTPQENPDGYKNADLTQHVESLQGKLLMIHGTDDDVVVMQHNMKFMKACVDKQVQVDFFAYPGHPHNVRGKDRYHLMTKVIDYMVEALK